MQTLIQYWKGFQEIMKGLCFKPRTPEKTIVNLLSQRSDLYNQCCDERIPTDGLSVEEISFGIAESARLWFSKMS